MSVRILRVVGREQHMQCHHLPDSYQINPPKNDHLEIIVLKPHFNFKNFLIPFKLLESIMEKLIYNLDIIMISG